MNVGSVLQTIGILTMALGGILAIEGVRNKIKKAKEQTMYDIIDTDFLGIILLSIGLISSIDKRKDETWLDINLPVLGSYVFFIYSSILEIKHTILQYIEGISIRMGIFLIFLGAVIQVVGIWL